MYSPLKVVHHVEALRMAKESHGLVVPRHLEINPTNVCNHNCTFCTYRSQSADSLNYRFVPSDKLELEDVQRLISEAKELGVRAIQFCGGGEPTLHGDLRAMIRRCLDEEMSVGLVTNGSRLHRSWAPDLCGVTWVRVSIDAATPETYAKVHYQGRGKGGSIDRAWAATAVCGDIEDCVVGVSYITTPDNVSEIAQAARLAKAQGADYIRIGAEVYTDGRDSTLHDMQDAIQQQISEAHVLSDEAFSIVDHATKRVNNASSTLYTEKDGVECHHAQMVGVIGADGWLYSCCVKKYCSDGRVTNVLDKSLRTALLGDERASYLQKLTPFTDCQSGCFLKPKNDIVNACLTAPDHVEFV